MWTSRRGLSTNTGSLSGPVTRGSCQPAWGHVGRCPREGWGGVLENLGSCSSTRLMRWGFGDRSFLKRHHSNDFIQSRVCNTTLIIYTPMIKQTNQKHRAALTRAEKGFSDVTSINFPTCRSTGNTYIQYSQAVNAPRQQRQVNM